MKHFSHKICLQRNTTGKSTLKRDVINSNQRSRQGRRGQIWNTLEFTTHCGRLCRPIRADAMTIYRRRDSRVKSADMRKDIYISSGQMFEQGMNTEIGDI